MVDKFVPPESAAQAADMFKQAATQSVDQARKAFDEALAATRKTLGGIEENASEVQDRLREVARDSVDFASQSAEAAFSLVESLARARSPEDALALQKAFIEQQMERLGRQTRQIGDQAVRTMQGLTKPFES
ncbi:phasin family protein [Oryzibacter oryziterrae]|uniref:phasin family protein n=1 Tax=Oryzibacter oryziterrae TaxID=2766474 RepID=UPI001F4429D8|nr:phasin family protein [Oryzibacter oryziterrae]